MKEQNQYIKALITLHLGLKRQGPGDPALAEQILRQLPKLPDNPRIADIGCGSGAGALMLAKRYHSRVKAVDFSAEFLRELEERAKQQGLEHLIEIIQSDMGNLNWPPAGIDLLWSEGAAYNITFAGALRAWRPLLASNGIAVISEMNYFSDKPPKIVSRYMKTAYPDIKTESQNIGLITALGFKVLKTTRLPSKAWWDNYYNPLCENIRKFKENRDSTMQAVISETEKEMQFFRAHDKDYGYTFYIIQAS